jgi:hypothetical protein
MTPVAKSASVYFIFPTEELEKALMERAYDILVEHLGASTGNKHSFVKAYLETVRPAVEWRFGGRLGFGGKFWRNVGTISVSCYTEDNSPERTKLITKVNTLLAELVDDIRKEAEAQRPSFIRPATSKDE